MPEHTDDGVEITDLAALSAGDSLDVFTYDGYYTATVETVDENPQGSVKLRLNGSDYRLKDTNDETFDLYEWRYGTEEDFADWRHDTTAKRIVKHPA